jgi:adenylate kinase
MNYPLSQKQLAWLKDWLGSGSVNIFGLPFSGKDTHARELAKTFDGFVVGGGDILRSRGQDHVKEHIAKGLLAPTDEYLATVLPYLSQAKFAKKPLFLSSVGRWHGEEPSVLEAAQQSSHPVKAVVYLKLDHAEVIARFEKSLTSADRGERHDDQLHILETRFNEFREKTLPVINFYKEQNLLIEVNGKPPIKEVNQEILSKLEGLSKK